MAERIVRNDRRLAAAEAAARVSEEGREERRIENANLVVEIVALRREADEMRKRPAQVPKETF